MSSSQQRRLVFGSLVIALVASFGSSASAQDVPFKVLVTELVQLGDFDTVGAIGDFYAEVTIDGVKLNNDPACSNNFSGAFLPLGIFHNFFTGPDCFRSTPWVFRRDLPGTGDPISVAITIRDSDIGGDDTGDAKRAPGSTVNLEIDRATGHWSGDFDWPQRCSRPGGFSADDLGGNNVAICWEIGFDRDGDGLLDVWEISGIDMDGDGTVDIDLEALGADPDHKDLFIELDWALSPDPDLQAVNIPTQQAVQNVKQAFGTAPSDAGGIPNPDSQPGINLWIDTGDLRDPAGREDGGDPGSCSDGQDNGGDGDTDLADDDCLVGDPLGGGNGYADTPIVDAGDAAYHGVRGANFDADVREFVFRYAISGNGCRGGGTAERPGNDMLVCGFGNGGSLMHELGHNLGLRHGGNEAKNCKPSYVSIMNYDHSRGILSAGPDAVDGLLLDYAPPRHQQGRSGPLPDLDETALEQGQVLDAQDGENFFVLVNPAASACLGGDDNGTFFCENDGDCSGGGACVFGIKQNRLIGQPVTWDSRSEDETVEANIDTSDAFTGFHSSCTNASLNLVRGNDDWSMVKLSFIEFGDSRTEAINPAPSDIDEPTQQELLMQQAALSTTDLEIRKSVAGPVEAGSEFAFTLEASNLGPNPAIEVVVVDALPAQVGYLADDAGCTQEADGSLRCELGDLLTGEAREFQISAVADGVCADGAPGDVENTARVFNDVSYSSEIDPNNNEVELLVDVVDTTPPTIACNSPETMRPPDAPLTVVATASDFCDDAVLVEVVERECFKVNGKGKRIEKPNCRVSFEGPALTVRNSGGVGQRIRWWVQATDSSGNVAEAECAIDVINR